MYITVPTHAQSLQRSEEGTVSPELEWGGGWELSSGHLEPNSCFCKNGSAEPLSYFSDPWVPSFEDDTQLAPLENFTPPLPTLRGLGSSRKKMRVLVAPPFPSWGRHPRLSFSTWLLSSLYLCPLRYHSHGRARPLVVRLFCPLSWWLIIAAGETHFHFPMRFHTAL